jgi:hypothetical protein
MPAFGPPQPGRWRACMSESAPRITCEFRTIMDVEHINAIGTALADLTERTRALRGYL